MYYLIAKDNYCRDYHNDKLIDVFDSLTEANLYADTLNDHPSSPYFYKVIEDLSRLNLESAYDINGDTPTFDQFLRMTGLNKIENSEAYGIYCNHYRINIIEE